MVLSVFVRKQSGASSLSNAQSFSAAAKPSSLLQSFTSHCGWKVRSASSSTAWPLPVGKAAFPGSRTAVRSTAFTNFTVPRWLCRLVISTISLQAAEAGTLSI